MTNEITLLKALRNGATINPKFQPQNNKQAYLAYLCGLDIALPEPRTAEEVLLYKLCVDGGKYLHTMTIRTYLGKITMTLKNNSAESLTGVYKENTDIFNGATLIIRGSDIGLDEDFYATVIGYEGGDIGILMIDKDFPFPVIGVMPNVIDVMSGEVIDTVTTKDGGKLEQEKKVEITKNGATEIFPDEGYTLSRVVANVNVTPSGENKLAQIVDGTLTEITEHDLKGATKIKDYAFSGCENLTNVTIPNSITFIGYYAFYSCKGLVNLIIPSSVKQIDGRAFSNCSNLTNVTLNDGVDTLSSYSFAWCSSLSNVIMSNTIKNIGDYSFYRCENLTSITIPSSVTLIGGAGLNIGSKSNKATITFLGTTPPIIYSDTFSTTQINKIIVPAGCGETYKSATNWSNFADFIEEAAE